MDPARILELIPVTRGRSWRITPLEGGLTNRNCRVDRPEAVDDPGYVLRLAGAGTETLGIDRDCEVACARAAAAVGITPAIVAYLPEPGART